MRLPTVKKILISHREAISELGARGLAIFGSTARNEGISTSDVDILVDFDPKRGMFVFLDLKQYLEMILNCEVDLVTKNALHPALKAQILREAKRVF